MAKAKHLNPFSEQLITDRLRFENPWWSTGKSDEEYDQMPRRLYFDLFYPLVEDTSVRRAVVLMGPRRVGKTVMLNHTIQHLLNEGINPKQICFINIENPIYNNIPLEQLFSYSRKATAQHDPKGWFVFFDEIQYLKDWEIHLKVLVDSYPKTKFVVSGSAAAALKLASSESGAGRFTDFMLPPLTFNEYISLKGLNQLIIPSKIMWNENVTRFFSTVNIKELNRHFIDYLNFGGYPEVIFSERIQANPARYIKSDIVDKVLLRDLPSLYGIQDVQELNSLFTTLAYHSGNEVSLESLSKASGVEKYLLKKYLEYLEAAFLIRIVHRIDDNAKKFKRANFYKIYLTNPSLRSALFSPLLPTDEAIGNMIETAIYSQWMHRVWFTPYYARWGNGEVDMVGLDEKKIKPQWALEIKWSNRFYEEPGELKSLIHFCENNKLSSALITTIDIEGQREQKGIQLIYVPASVYAYVVGNNTLEQKLKKSR
ncbi:MAG: ATP-binding protein [Saprospiraceae bacterium]|nr:ATP-binding protein [Saprospiraceae bacterium]MDZ4704488.1 ATP-binding protein [Saprospiraceae bacterium]